MSAVADAAGALYAALAAIGGVRAYKDPAAAVDPPAAVLGPPSLSWRTGCAGPDIATWHCYVVEAMNERALERLWDLVPLVAAAVDEVPNAVVTEASPGAYSSGGTDLPSYDITIEVGL